MDINLIANRAQMVDFLLMPKCQVSVEGRGTGKSASIGFWIDRLVRDMPRSVIALTGKTFGQLLTRTLPSSLKILNSMGCYQKDVNYVIGKNPPRNFMSSHEELNKFDNVISFSNGTRIAMISQSEPGSGRGANFDFEIVDEALLINREQYNEEISPANRGNHEFYGKRAKHYSYLHHGWKYSTSMPVTKEGRWVLDYADYYLKERGIRIFDQWNKIVQLQTGLLELTEPKEFTQLWNEIANEKSKMRPFVSKDGLLFTLSNAFDNIDFLKMSYIRRNYNQLPLFIFMTEIMNMYYDKVEDCFYSLNEDKQVYYDSYDEQRLKDYANEVSFDLDAKAMQKSIYWRDCDPSLPIELSFDWGSKISLMVVFQERTFDFVNQKEDKEHIYETEIAEFFSKPDGKNNYMIGELIGNFCEQFQYHPRKDIVFYKDKYGDHRQPNVMNSRSYNELAIASLESHGWSVEVREHRGMEPPMSDKYLLWGLILKENNDNLPRFRFNGDRCRYSLISMNNAKVKSVDNKLTKDKSTERPDSGVLPEEATHFSDAIDKIMWTKFGGQLPSGADRSSYTSFGIDIK